ncbi:unnamed protein product [Mycena citricolor]|uniref:Pyridoxal-dependent decarboxylase n=1 Tax=Mycena citricolor TaxID=2018698 RepID=A0AAD2HGC3_9AGAR|nr:unnamed protein product [Mycena citricolor]CAK5274265.1 unnamed protein product [Mycena citricolor]
MPEPVPTGANTITRTTKFCLTRTPSGLGSGDYMALSDYNANAAGAQQAVPHESDLLHAQNSLIVSLPDEGLGFDATLEHLTTDIAPGFHGSNRCPTYYAYTTGAVTDAALFADWLVSQYDQNVSVHLPSETVATTLEAITLKLLQQLFSIDELEFTGRVFTTGATASNLIGLALGREYVIREAGRRKRVPSAVSVTKSGFLEACVKVGAPGIQIIGTVPHASMYKAASIAGIGRDSFTLLPLSDEQPWRFNVEALEAHLSRGPPAIVLVSAGDVSCGRFATNGEELVRIRALADEYGAWVHVDGAFGLQALILPEKTEYRIIAGGISGILLADSLAGDAHKMLNVPYDCGFFFTRYPDLQEAVFQNPNSPYLATQASSTPSPLNMGIENSRRFRALPVYASLLAYGRDWFSQLLERQILLARRIAEYIDRSPRYELLPDSRIEAVYIVVLFRAQSEALNARLVSEVNATNRLRLTVVEWRGRPAARMAIATWRVEIERDFETVKQILETVVYEVQAS